MSARKSADRLALLGGTPVRDRPFASWPEHGEEEKQAVLEALRRGEWGGYPLPNLHTGRFVEAFCRRHDSRHGVCVANGTVSLEIALQALGVESGAEVIVPAYTFEATASAVLFAGAVPVFADVEEDSWCLDPDDVEARITERTRALVPVHLAMNLADMDRLGAIAERHGLVVLEDCAHAHGARWRGRAVGSLGDAGSFSFQTSKLMTAGEGGIVITSDEEVFDRLHALTNCGRQRPGARSPARVIGHNYRMTDLQAAILECQLDRLDDQHGRRERHAARLEEGLRRIPGLALLPHDDRVTRRAVYQFVFRYLPEEHAGVHRDVFVAALVAEGVPCDGRFYESLPTSELLPRDSARYPAWAAREPESCPLAHRLAYSESVWLPHWLLLGDERDVDDVVEAVAKVGSQLSELAHVDHPQIRRLATARASRL